MPRRKGSDLPLTPLELAIMTVLWETGPANVQTVQEKLKGRNLAYTTVQTMLNVLQRKGKVKRRLKNRAYLYGPVFTRKKATQYSLGELLDRFFGGEADRLVMNLVETRKLTPERLAEIQKLLKKPPEAKDGNS